MKLLRPHFDAALASLSGDLYVTLTQREALWQALVGTTAAARQRKPHWTAEASALFAPLERELKALRQQQAVGSIDRRYAGIQVSLPRSGNNQPPQQFIVLHVYAQYGQRLRALHARLERALRDGGHWCTSADNPDLIQPIEVIAENERAAGRPAGTLDWTQWENPGTVRVITQVFEKARIATNAQSKPGRQWAPYVPNTGKPGAAETSKALGKWRGEFHDAIHEPLDEYRNDKPALPLARFYESLKAPQIQQHIETAIRAQVKLRRGPTNPAFRVSIWHALDNQTRLQLAAAYDQALRECAEGVSAKGLDAARFSPAVNPNPWAIGEAQATTPIPLVQPFNTVLNEEEVPAKYDEEEPEQIIIHPAFGGLLD
jgi:hypothetical protein